MKRQEYPEDYYREYNGMEQLGLTDSSLILIDLPQRQNETNLIEHWYLFPNGTTVAYLTLVEHLNNADERYVIGSIEVREQYRGMGLVKEFIQALETHYNAPIYSSGLYTPIGLERLAHGARLKQGVTPQLAFKELSFVLDWTLLVSK